MEFSTTKLGILGGGQLGKMLLQTAMNYDLQVSVLDPDKSAPCQPYAHMFVAGKLTDYETVLKFGEKQDIITIEIENVNTEALETLEKQGKKVFPQPHIIRLIQDKRLQKQFYQENDIPTAPFFLIDQKNDLKKYADFLPAVQKLGREGYDGRGVKVMHTVADLAQGFEQPSLLEKKVDILKEISVIVARNQQGEVKHFPPVEVVYHSEKNLVDYLLSPAQLPEKIAQKAVEIAYTVIEKLGMVGILAVEMFWDKQNQVLVNEIAPRPHNSGHQTIEANLTSQYEQHLRSILNLPLGNTAIRSLSAMINLLGENGHEGNARYLGLEKVLEMDGVYVHLYGKKTTKPYRKMGHITVLATNMDELNAKVQHIKHLVKVVAQ